MFFNALCLRLFYWIYCFISLFIYSTLSTLILTPTPRYLKVIKCEKKSVCVFTFLQIPLLQIKNNVSDISDSGNDIWLLLTFLFENISNLLNDETSIISCITFFIDYSFISIVLCLIYHSLCMYRLSLLVDHLILICRLQITPQYFGVIVFLRVTVKLSNLGDLTLIQYCNWIYSQNNLILQFVPVRSLIAHLPFIF